MLLSNFRSTAVSAKFALGLLVVFLPIALGGDGLGAKKPEKARAESSSGLHVSRSPETGALQSEKIPATPGVSALSIGQPRQVVLANGLVMARSTEEHMSSSVVTRDADGKLAYQCLAGAHAAQAFLNRHVRSAGKPAPGKERVHVAR